MRSAELELLAAWLRDHHGVITARDLRGLDFSRHSTRSLVRSHRLVAEHRGIYRSPSYPFGRLQIMVAACLANPDAAIGFTTAGQEWRFRRMVDQLIHLLVPHGSSPNLPWVVVHRCRQIDEVDLAGRRRDGIRLTSPPRTLFDASSMLDIDAAASAIEQAISERRCTIETLRSTLKRLHHPNRLGAQRFEAVLLSRPALRGAARSDLEREVRAAVAAAGLPDPMVNMPHRLPDGVRIEIDLAWPEWKVAVEVDHPFWHDRESEAARDKLRDRKLTVLGWLPMRISKADVDHHLLDAVDDIGAVLVQRGWTGRAA